MHTKLEGAGPGTQGGGPAEHQILGGEDWPAHPSRPERCARNAHDALPVILDAIDTYTYVTPATTDSRTGGHTPRGNLSVDESDLLVPCPSGLFGAPGEQPPWRASG